MTNEELAMKIQAGETDLMNELWRQVERFVIKQANRFFYTYQDRCEKLGLTVEDLYQEGYFAIHKSVEVFNAEKDCTFLTYAGYQLKRVFFNTAKMHSTGWQKNTTHQAISLDKQRSIGENEVSLFDALEDESSQDEIDDVVENDFNKCLSKDLNNIINLLTERQAYVIKRRFYDNIKPVNIARELGVHKTTINSVYQKALTNIRKHKELEPYFVDMCKAG